MNIFRFAYLKSRQQRAFMLLAFAGVLNGCASHEPPPQPSAPSLVKQADDAMSSGASDKAVELLTEAAKTDPADKDVWVKLAHVQFERHDYPKAITAATEALARVPDNQDARSVMFVSSMRLAVISLNDIRKDVPLNDDSKTEAELLVKSLRDTLGEAVLVPNSSEPKARARPHPIAKADPAPAKSKPAKASPEPTSSGSDDPFSTLR